MRRWVSFHSTQPTVYNNHSINLAHHVGRWVSLHSTQPTVYNNDSINLAHQVGWVEHSETQQKNHTQCNIEGHKQKEAPISLPS